MRNVPSWAVAKNKEVGVKKVLGAGNGQIVKYFLTETIGMTVVSSIAAFALAQLFLPQINILFEKDIPSSLLLQPGTLGFLGGVVLLTGFVSGLFPSLLLAKFRPVSVLRSTIKLSPGGQLPRQVLTTLQLAINRFSRLLEKPITVEYKKHQIGTDLNSQTSSKACIFFLAK